MKWQQGIENWFRAQTLQFTRTRGLWKAVTVGPHKLYTQSCVENKHIENLSIQNNINWSVEHLNSLTSSQLNKNLYLGFYSDIKLNVGQRNLVNT
jgi:hypothetical protein